MFEKLSLCPSCGHNTFHNHLICKDYSITQEEFAIVMCDNCELLFTNPRPNKENLDRYYDSANYISHADKTNGVIDLIYKIVRKYSVKQKIKIISEYSKNRTLLDYGCGTGYFLKEAINQNWNVEGIEPNQKARELANEQLNRHVKESLTQIPDTTKYTIITLWHVLEHVYDLSLTLDLLINHLEKNGHLLVAVPNPESYDAQVHKNFWAGYDVPRHLYHFSKSSMKILMKNHGLKIVSILPMKFDSYYVSMLSEKYKTGNPNIIKSMITGYKSNSYASKNDDAYSSLIYILTKK